MTGTKHFFNTHRTQSTADFSVAFAKHDVFLKMLPQI
jgi:hypothetical protein